MLFLKFEFFNLKKIYFRTGGHVMILRLFIESGTC